MIIRPKASRTQEQRSDEFRQCDDQYEPPDRFPHHACDKCQRVTDDRQPRPEQAYPPPTAIPALGLNNVPWRKRKTWMVGEAHQKPSDGPVDRRTKDVARRCDQ